MSFKVIRANILGENDNAAGDIRARLASGGVFMINMISSPGSGKTSLLEKLGPVLEKNGIRFVIITGDCFTSRDAERLDRLGLAVVQINTGGACHIDARLVDASLRDVDLGKTDLVIIENVGNLVCPTDFDLGEDLKVAVLSTTEGHDKPVKYPMLIRKCALAVINKTDLIPHTDFDMDICERSINELNNKAKIIKMSCKTGEGTDILFEWIKNGIQKKKESAK